MKSRKEMRKPTSNDFAASEEFKRGQKLRPAKKEKNLKQSLFKEIDDLDEFDDPELSFVSDDFEDDLYDDDDDF